MFVTGCIGLRVHLINGTSIEMLGNVRPKRFQDYMFDVPLLLTDEDEALIHMIPADKILRIEFLKGPKEE